MCAPHRRRPGVQAGVSAAHAARRADASHRRSPGRPARRLDLLRGQMGLIPAPTTAERLEMRLAFEGAIVSPRLTQARRGMHNATLTAVYRALTSRLGQSYRVVAYPERLAAQTGLSESAARRALVVLRALGVLAPA